MKDVIKPPTEPIKGLIKDYRCSQSTTEEKDEGDIHITITRPVDLTEITLKELIEHYKNCNPEDIKIKAIHENFHEPSLIILRPQTDIEFETEMKKYKEKLEWFNNWEKK